MIAFAVEKMKKAVALVMNLATPTEMGVSDVNHYTNLTGYGFSP